MEHFRTIVDIPPSKTKMGYHNKTMLIGSCFTENIGGRLEHFKLPVDVNPFGVIYNPVSVGNSLRALMDEKRFEEEDLNFANQQWFSFYHHSRFSHSDLDECLIGMNDRMEKSSRFLREADFLFITFGTAWVYELIESGEVVSNCHKLPARDFNRYRLNVDEIVEMYKELILSLSLWNPKLKIVFTVSPIRHWKDGAHGNQLSKATLLLAVEQLVELFEQVCYFPSYEIVMDDLRDYRFFSEDMLHISPVAIDYIWKRFEEVYLSNETRKLMPNIEKVIRASCHRPFNTKSDAHQKFLQNQILKVCEMMKNYPFLDLSEEKNNFEKNLLD
ncbi:MAG: GSCFA domain-containing protein [Marinifilaceae bacterium]